MGIRLVVEVLRHAPTTLTHREKLLLVALAEDARDETRRTWNSVEAAHILTGAKLSRAELYAVLKRLIAKDVIKRVSAGQRNGVAKYELLPLSQCQQNPDTEPPVKGQQFPDTDAPQCQQNADTDPPSQCQQNPDTDDSQSQQFPDTDDSQCQQIPDAYSSKERDRSISPAPDATAAFDAFWREYPRKVAKGQARTAFAAAVKRGTDPAHITAAAVRHRDHWQRAGRATNFIPYPATWLRGESYDDDLHTPTPPPPPAGRYTDPTERGIF